MQSLMEFGNWLFNDRTGVVCLIVGGMIICLLISILMERKTKQMYFNHEKTDDDWDLFGDDDDE